jgi:branched-chain amino acid transport system permease protein
MRRGIPILVLAAWLALPWLPGMPPFWITLADYAGISAVVVIGIVVLTGMAGITSFGQATFMGFGAYTTALLTTQAGLSPWLALPAALVVSGAVSLIIGAVTLRLSGHYLAVGTIAWSVAFYYVFGNLDFFGRNDGISGIPPLRVGGIALLDSRAYFPVIWCGVALALLATRNLLDSRIGRAVRALHGGAAAAASFGVNRPATRMLAFAYAAMLAGLAGWLYAHMQRAVNPTPFGLNAGIEDLLMAVVGGVGQLWGALLGAGLVTVVNDRLQDILPRLLGSTGNYETIVFGILLVLLLQTSPEGLWPHLSRLAGRRQAPAHPGGGEPLPSRALPVRGTPVLEAVGLVKAFGGLVAVNDLSLRLDAGEIVGLIGPNGAGKSTTFNLLTGVARPDAGVVRFMGADLAGSTPPDVARLGIARSFQQVKLAPGMSVLENVALGAHLRGAAGALRAVLRLDRAEEARLFAEAHRQLARVGLADYASRPAKSLALGQQRIVEIARALCLDPVLLLLDEPAAGLRHAEKGELASLLQTLRGQGVTILLVEHDMDFVMNLTDRLVVMNFGAKLAEGPAAAIRRNPAVIEAYLGSAA